MNFICPKCGCSYESDEAKCPYCNFTPKKQAKKPVKLTCSECGFSYDSDLGKCPYCESTRRKPALTPEQQIKRTKRTLGIAFIVTIGIIVVCALWDKIADNIVLKFLLFPPLIFF